jgi:hypothetical protein
MIALPAGVKVWLVAGATDMRNYAPRINMSSRWWRPCAPVERSHVSALHNVLSVLWTSTSQGACQVAENVLV